MKLIGIEAKGFKSFADRVVLTFDGGVVGVVGPNGSGKSNINDAIRWVLGERSIKALRGGTSEDIIFAGSKGAPPAQKAEVALTFESAGHELANKQGRVILKRTMVRGSGESLYYINDEPARLHDIEKIAMQSGISKSSLAIISQGTIQNIAQASPADRRAIFEDAAGVAVWKARRAENTRKLERITEALDKVRAVLRELNRQLGPLQKQAEKARLFLHKKAELKAVEVALLADDIAFFTDQLTTLNQSLQGVLSERANLDTKLAEVETAIITSTRAKAKLETEISSLTHDLQFATDELVQAELLTSQVAQRRQMLINNEVQTTSAARVQAMREELEALSQKLGLYDATLEKMRAELATLSTAQQRDEAASRALVLQGDTLRNKVANARARLEYLRDTQARRTNLFKGPRTILENQSLFPGVLGIVADLVTIPQQVLGAVEILLAATTQHVVVDKATTAVSAINFLKANRAGRATFIPLDTIKPRAIAYEHRPILEAQPGFIGIAGELVTGKPEHDVLRKFLLGNAIVVDEISHAEAIGRLMRHQYSIATLDGDLVRPGGTMTGGERSENREVLGLNEQITELATALPALEQAAQADQVKLGQLQQQMSERQLLMAQMNIEVTKTAEKRTFAFEQFTHLKAQYEGLTTEAFTAAKAPAALDPAAITLRQSELRAQLNAKREALTALNRRLTADALVKTELEKSLRVLVDSAASQLTAKNQAEFVLNDAQKRLSEEYQLTPEAARAEFTLTMDRDEARAIVGKLRQEIKDLGHVNLDAMAAYDEVYDKHAALSAREAEVYDAQQIIVAAIDEIDQITILKLNETVTAVNAAISVIFQKMFGGGHAEVVYTNPKDLLETGIEIVAQPPGKTIKNINLFSGGEKALVAISLLFALLRAKPIPLCILDEVEAALDEANVIRFANYLQELKHQTQFIVITHRPQTMSRVDQLFGVTMQTKGVTSLVAVRLAEATALGEPAPRHE